MADTEVSELTRAERAEEASKWFETRTREDGPRFWTLKADRPEWVHDLVMEAHGDFMPDDWRYEFIRDALEVISYTEDEDDYAGAVDSDVNVYNSDLLRWVSSNLLRMGYVDQATEDYGPHADLARGLMAGQYAEREEVLGLVVSFLDEMED